MTRKSPFDAFWHFLQADARSSMNAIAQRTTCGMTPVYEWLARTALAQPLAYEYFLRIPSYHRGAGTWIEKVASFFELL
jgi:hypothetical protein